MKTKVLLILSILNLFLLCNLNALELIIEIQSKETKIKNLFSNKCSRFDSSYKARDFVDQIEANLQDRWDETWDFYEKNKSKLPSCVIEALESLKGWTKVELEWNSPYSMCLNNGDVASFDPIGQANEEWQNPVYYYGLFKIWDIWGPLFKLEGDKSSVKYCTDSIFFHEILHMALADPKFSKIFSNSEGNVEDCELKLYNYPDAVSPCMAYPGYILRRENKYEKPNDQYDTCQCCKKK